MALLAAARARAPPPPGADAGAPDAGAPDARPDAGAADAGTRRPADAGAATGDARAVFEPPRALTDTEVPYPTAAPRSTSRSR